MGKGKEKNKEGFKSDVEHKKLGLLDEQTLGYYRRISETLRGNFESDVEQELFVNNVFTQLSREVLKVSQNQTVSRIVEELIPRGGRDHIVGLLGALAADWETSCCDRFASFVTQSLLLNCNQYLGSSEDSAELSTLIDDLYSFLMSQIALYMQHTYASHVLRVLLEVLAGVKVSDQIIKSRLSRGTKPAGASKDSIQLKRPPQSYSKKLLVMCETIVKLNKLSDHIQNGLSSPVLQTVLLVSRTLGADQHAAICQALLQSADVFKATEEEELPVNVMHEVASHFIELLLTTVPIGWLDKIITDHFINKLLKMAKHPLANFVLQRLLTSLQSDEQYATVFTELSPHLESILALNHTGVIVKMCETCVRLQCKQKKFIKALMKAFHCYKPEERQCKLFPLVASLTAYEVFYNIKVKQDSTEDTSTEADEQDSSNDDSSDNEADDIKIPMLTTINYHGSVLLQNLMRFSNPKPVATGLMELKTAELRTVCMDTCGSHIIEAFLNSETVGEKAREAFCNKLKGQLVDLACDRLGSRVFDSLWKRAALKQRCTMADELVRQEQRLRSNKFGFYVHSRCGLSNYRTRPEEWKEYQSGQLKKRKQFDEALQSDDAPAAKKSGKASR